jgi:branched-subunit amino acid aminotransferase/4-amino-4-deoxychorismate lyase
LHTCNQLGQIMAKMEANQAGAHEALMLDMQGFLAETNTANIFIVSSRRLVTPKRDSIMPGLTRGMEIAPQLGLTAAEENISPADIYMADEMFLTGTVNQIVPITEVDGRRLGGGQPGPHTARPARRLSRALLMLSFYPWRCAAEMRALPLQDG